MQGAGVIVFTQRPPVLHDHTRCHFLQRKPEFVRYLLKERDRCRH